MTVRRVHGRSMLPVLPPGTLVIARRTQNLRVGDVVIFYHEGREKVKRLKDIQGSKVFVISDNPEDGSDSRQYGWLPLSTITGKVIVPRGLRSTKPAPTT